ncbi:FLU1-II [Coprinellus micaceus]|uniref:Glutamine synthetase n=1 Tax=Coprinellus micaceus TaxID=71717 RepID=A0A4Y7TJ90_COPMI|nr:FLU1-II [Coprinellus micaceus]
MSTVVGVTYPRTGPQAPHPAVVLLQSQNIAYIRVQWVDLTNQIRYRVLPLAYFAKLLQSSNRPAVSLTKATLGMVFLNMSPGFTCNGEYSYVFDLDSLRTSSYAPSHAIVMGWFQEKYPSPSGSFDVDLCPRALLKRISEQAHSQSNVDFLVGFETEFILLNKSDHSPVNNHGWSCSPALLSGSVEAAVLEEIADVLARDGIELQMYHAEGTPGQYEVVTGPLPPLQAADALIHTRETIYNVANKHGLRATLAPRVFGDNPGSGTHVHISVHGHDGNAASPEEAGRVARPWTWEGLELRPAEASFLAGVLDHLPALCVFTLPFYASYGRVRDGIWSGGTFACWGVEHRETPLRVCNPASPSSRNFELKMMDGTSNPYLTLAGILGAGWAAGISKQKELRIKPITSGASAVELTTEERASLGIQAKLPLTIGEAQEAASKDEELQEILGAGFVDAYLRVTKYKNERYDLSDAEKARLLLIDHY